MELTTVIILASLLVLIVGLAGYLLLQQPELLASLGLGMNATSGSSGSQTGAANNPGNSGSVLGPFQSNNPDVGEPPSPG